jgi:hypothetical protein
MRPAAGAEHDRDGHRAAGGRPRRLRGAPGAASSQRQIVGPFIFFDQMGPPSRSPPLVLARWRRSGGFWLACDANVCKIARAKPAEKKRLARRDGCLARRPGADQMGVLGMTPPSRYQCTLEPPVLRGHAASATISSGICDSASQRSCARTPAAAALLSPMDRPSLRRST